MEQKMKIYKGEKYIYLLMAYKLAKANKNYVTIGRDDCFKGGNHYYRTFKIQHYKFKTLLIETKTSDAFADYSRVFEIDGDESRPSIMDYMNEDNENAGQNWTH